MYVRNAVKVALNKKNIAKTHVKLKVKHRRISEFSPIFFMSKQGYISEIIISSENIGKINKIMENHLKFSDFVNSQIVVILIDIF